MTCKCNLLIHRILSMIIRKSVQYGNLDLKLDKIFIFALVFIETCFFETFKNTSIRAFASLNGLLVDSKKAIQGRGRSSGYKDEQP